MPGLPQVRFPVRPHLFPGTVALSGGLLLAGLSAGTAQAATASSLPASPASSPAAVSASPASPLIDLGASAQLSLGPVGLGVCLHVAAVPGLVVQAAVGVTLGPLTGAAAANVAIGSSSQAGACPGSAPAAPAPRVPPATPAPAALGSPSSPAPPVIQPPPSSPASSAAAVAVPPRTGPPASGPPGASSAARPASAATPVSTPASARGTAVAQGQPPRRQPPPASVLLRPLGRAQLTTAAHGGMTAAVLAMVFLVVLTMCIAAATTRFGGRPR